jgi:hypothetical protein
VEGLHKSECAASGVRNGKLEPGLVIATCHFGTGEMPSSWSLNKSAGFARSQRFRCAPRLDVCLEPAHVVQGRVAMERVRLQLAV